MYTPSVAINLGNLNFNLFTRPSCRHYYFGDYFGETYVSYGFRPWHSFDRSYYRYDPWFAYEECHYRRRDPNWFVNLQVRYDSCRNNIDLRPPRTFAQVNQIGRNNITQIGNNNNITVVNYNTFVTNNFASQNQRFVRVNDNDRQRINEVGIQNAVLRKNRLEREFRVAANLAPGELPNRIQRVDLLKSSLSEAKVIASQNRTNPALGRPNVGRPGGANADGRVALNLPKIAEKGINPAIRNNPNPNLGIPIRAQGFGQDLVSATIRTQAITMLARPRTTIQPRQDRQHPWRSSDRQP